ncbi:MAG: hypothetical protein QM730_18800 [Anaerolineales bacterium]
MNRFLQPDTIIPDPSNPQSWNRYSYTQNNPINFDDPTGHITCDDNDENGNCVNYEQIERRKANRLKRLQKELDDFVPPEKVKQEDMIPIADKYNDATGEWETVYLAPDEFNLFVYQSLGSYYFPGAINYGGLIIMSGLQDNATDTTYDLFSDFDDGAMHNSPSDAFHHAYWSALITREFGADFANQFTMAHEGRPFSERNEAFMDLHNNQVGIGIASANPNATDAELQAAVLDKLYNGQLYVWDGEDIYFSNQCPSCWWRAK